MRPIEGYATAQRFASREEAASAARELEAQRWRTRVQFVGAWDAYIVEASRKSWGYRYAARVLRTDGGVR